MIQVGINLHSNNMVNVAINDNAEPVREANLPTNRRSLDDFFDSFDQPDRRELTCGRLRMIRRRGKLQSSLWNQAITDTGYQLRVK